MFSTRVAWVCLICLLFSIVFAITENRVMGLYEVPLSMCLLGFGMVTILTNLHMCGIMFLLRAVLNMRLHKGLCWFRCMMFSLSGPCELLFLFGFIAS